MTDTATDHRLETILDRHWVKLALLAWLGFAVWVLVVRWGAVQWLVLSDTDDNMRLMQVRGLLNGQGWYDLRQYRLNPPGGLDIHWSRIVDLPIAAMILILKPFVGTGWAERIACGIAPLLPLGVTVTMIALTVRRLVTPVAWPLALLLMLGCTATLLMYYPMRIDHHGWQLASLSVTVAGLCDPRRARGGLIVGIASAFSLSIGLEMLPYCAMAGAIIALRWVWDRDEAERLAIYALSLAGGSAAGYVAFASYANTALRCDALTPVWLSVLVVGGALLFALSRINPARREVRLALAIAAAAIIAGGFAWLFPQCLGRPEGVSDELARTWLNNVREAKPIYAHPLRTAFPVAAVPVIGLIGAGLATWRARGTPALTGWITVALFGAFAAAMLLWQVRAGPAAQLLAVPGTTALAWVILPWFLSRPSLIVRVFGTVAAFLVVSGLFAGYVIQYLPADKASKLSQRVGAANRRCPTLPALQPLDRLPPATMFTHVDLGPRLITVTHHNGIAGPYHRNGDAILDVHHAFMGTADGFRAIAKRHGASYLLICPDMAETTVYRARSPGGFYAQLSKGQVPAWLEPVPLPRGSPLRLWRIRY